MTTLVYVVATRPYAEKVSNNLFFMNFSDAEEYWYRLANDIRDSFFIYPALLTIEKTQLEIDNVYAQK